MLLTSSDALNNTPAARDAQEICGAGEIIFFEEPRGPREAITDSRRVLETSVEMSRVEARERECLRGQKL
jgi:hypothetical protein